MLSGMVAGPPVAMAEMANGSFKTGFAINAGACSLIAPGVCFTWVPGADTVVYVQGQGSPSKDPQSKGKGTQTKDKDAPEDPKPNILERMFRLPPLQQRLLTKLQDEWQFTDVHKSDLAWLMSEDGVEMRHFFMDGINISRYKRLVKEFNIGTRNRRGVIENESFATMKEYGPELMTKFTSLVENRELIKKYYAGVFQAGRIDTPALIRIGSSTWMTVFNAPKFRQAAFFLHKNFQIPEHVIGPMLGSVGNNYALYQVLGRKTAPQEFNLLLSRLAGSAGDDSANAFSPALQLMVLAQQEKIPFKTLDSFVAGLGLRGKDLPPFSAIVFNLDVFHLTAELKCAAFGQYVRKVLMDYGPNIDQKSAGGYLDLFREFKNNQEALENYISPRFADTRAYLQKMGVPLPASPLTLARITYLAGTLTPETRNAVAAMVRQLAVEVKVPDVIFLAGIAHNPEDVKLVLNRQSLLAEVAQYPIGQTVTRTRNDHIEALNSELGSASNGPGYMLRKLLRLIKEEKSTYSEKLAPERVSNITLAQLAIFMRSMESPEVLPMFGRSAFLDLQNERSEGGGIVAYHISDAMVDSLPGPPYGNRMYRRPILDSAGAQIAWFHNHVLPDTPVDKITAFFRFLFGTAQSRGAFNGPSGWLNADRGDITVSQYAEIPGVVISKLKYRRHSDSIDFTFNIDWYFVDEQGRHVFDLGVRTVTVKYEEATKFKDLSSKEWKQVKKAQAAKCPPVAGLVAESSNR